MDVTEAKPGSRILDANGAAGEIVEGMAKEDHVLVRMDAQGPTSKPHEVLIDTLELLPRLH